MKTVRHFIIGDIHGCFDELMMLTRQIGLTDDDVLISLGDIVDRGNKSKEVYHYFRQRPHSIVLMGNHERKHLNGVLNYAQDIVKLQLGAEYPAFLEWAAQLPYYYETPEAIIVHAALEHDVPLATQREDVLCGATAGEKYLEKKYPEANWADKYMGEKPVIYGHRVVGNQPLVHNNTYGIDTGCCHGGYLTAVELPGFIIHQVACEQDYWKTEQQQWQVPVLQAKNWGEMELTAIKRQLDKLAYIEEPAARSYLDQVHQGLLRLEALFPVLKEKLDTFAGKLLEAGRETFSREANQYPFKTYLFKSSQQNLKVEDLQKSLLTPEKINQLAIAMGLAPIDFPPSINTKR
ncbi:metallophosphoesterase [Chitinophaga qingshengii]|uniref:Metallophosphoesterase n=1 Tax=Chitinophaga qingshengii TaxID=1569794 RepID=A0ABR7TIC8_9BACT|nr:metallophosphoesterase [Chitinophaga qingshengii]MBC9930261.1 metallophosphoesterase [Chitinophaga qingshengii]